jgi:alanine racemase
VHCANSIGLLKYKEAHFNLVRPGLILYGIKPRKIVPINLVPILSLKSRVIFLKDVGSRRSIGYGRTFITTRPMRIATVAVGYADGYLWNLSNRARVIIKDRLCPLRGRVCMDHIMVEVPNTESVRTGTEVLLIGKSPTHALTVETIAAWAKTIPYEIVSRLSPTLPRFYK